MADLDVVFLATGTGIAPIKAMLEQLDRAADQPKPRSVHLLWGGRHSTDLYWQPDSGALGLHYTPVLSRADASWTGARGHVQDILLATQHDWNRTVVYACGSSAMIAGARSALTAAGLPGHRFFSDAFVSSSN